MQIGTLWHLYPIAITSRWLELILVKITLYIPLLIILILTYLVTRLSILLLLPAIWRPLILAYPSNPATLPRPKRFFSLALSSLEKQLLVFASFGIFASGGCSWLMERLREITALSLPPLWRGPRNSAILRPLPRTLALILELSTALIGVAANGALTLQKAHFVLFLRNWIQFNIVDGDLTLLVPSHFSLPVLGSALEADIWVLRGLFIEARWVQVEFLVVELNLQFKITNPILQVLYVLIHTCLRQLNIIGVNQVGHSRRRLLMLHSSIIIVSFENVPLTFLEM